MISSQKVRPSMQITLADIFVDYNDPRKQLLVKRVKLALEDQQKRLLSQLDSVNLTNLQKMLKKDFHLKTVEKKLQTKQLQIDQLQSQITYYKVKIQQLQEQVSKYTQMIRVSESKFKQIKKSVQDLQSIVQNKDKQYIDLEQENKKNIQQKNKFQQQKDRYQKIIFNLRQNYDQKLNQSQFSIKIKEQQLNAKYMEDIQSLKTSQLIQNQQNQIKQKIRNTLTIKNQRIQCQILRNTSPRHSGRQSTRLSHRSPRKKVQKEDKQIQTQQTQQSRLKQFLENKDPQQKPMPKQNQKLNQIRFYYSQVPETIPLPQPKLIKYTASSWQTQQIQTDPIIVLSQDKQVQISTESPSQAASRQVKELKSKYDDLKMTSQQKYNNLWKKSMESFEKAQKLEDLEYKNRALELLICQKNAEILRDRDTIARTNQQLLGMQNSHIFAKLKQNPPVPSSRKSKFSRTCTMFNTPPKNKSTMAVTPNKTHYQPQTSLVDSTYFHSPQKEDSEQEEDLITIIKQANNLKSFTTKKRSVTQSNPCVTSPAGSLLLKRNYGKFSFVKKR